MPCSLLLIFIDTNIPYLHQNISSVTKDSQHNVCHFLFVVPRACVRARVGAFVVAEGYSSARVGMCDCAAL